MWRLSARALLFVLMSCSAAFASDDIVQKAMRDELDRSMRELTLANLERPYFIAYRIMDVTSTSASATFGSLIRSRENHVRMLNVEIRVGDYSFDNTGFISARSDRGDRGSSGFVNVLSLDDNYEQLRRYIWLATDIAYKKALEDLAGKQSIARNKNLSEGVPDFTHEYPVVADDIQPSIDISRLEIEKRVRSVSSLFREMPEVLTSSVRLLVANVDTRYINSEGTAFHKLQPWVSFDAKAALQASDGMPLDNSLAIYARKWIDLPTTEEITSRLRRMVAETSSLKRASPLGNYNGPVLFEDEAGAEVLEQVFLPGLLASKAPVSDNPRLLAASAQQQTSFVNRIGSRVLPSFVGLSDDPTLEEYLGKQLPITYKIDDEGVSSHATVLVQNGTLKTLLSTRTPVEGLSHSTGNRWGEGPMATNVVVAVSKGYSRSELRQRLLRMVTERGLDYGIIVRRVSNPVLADQEDGYRQPGSTSSEAPLNCLLAYKVFPDGREELTRNLQLSGLNATAFRDVAGVSTDLTLITEPMRTASVTFLDGGDPNVVSVAAPSLLFENVTLGTPTVDAPRPPVMPHPYFDSRN